MADIKFRNLSSFVKILCLDVSEISVYFCLFVEISVYLFDTKKNGLPNSLLENILLLFSIIMQNK